MKKLFTMLALLSASQAQAALMTGDLAFTSFNADEDGWALTTFVDIAANTDIYFNDNEWDGSAFNTGESAYLWNTGASTIAAGSVIRFSDVDKNSLATSSGFFSVLDNSNLGLSATDDTIYAYLGSSYLSPTTFLAAISNASDIAGSKGGLINTGLVEGVSAIELTSSTDFAEYTGPRSGELGYAGYKPLVGDIANWNMVVGGNQELQLPNTTAFTVTAVPEPETYAMLLAGLGLMGFSTRRQSK